MTSDAAASGRELPDAGLKSPEAGRRMSRLLLVDGHAYAYRAFHAIRELRGPGGEPVNAVFGFVKTLLKLQGTVGPTHWAVIWDGGLAAERLATLPDYKAQRPPMPDSLARQLDEIVAWLEAMRIASGCRDGVEADDWIASLAHWAQDAGASVVIASADKDFMQLVSGRVGLLNPHDKSETVWMAGRVREKSGVAPEQIVDWLSLVGDTVDNIPGVPGVGVKTAAELLGRFGSVSRLYARLAEVKSERVRSALAAAAADVSRNQELIRLKTDLPAGFSPEELAVKPPDAVKLRDLYGRWGFRSLRATVAEPASGQTALF